MIVIKPRYPKRRYRYGGSGVFGNLFKKVISSAIAEKVVNAATKHGVKKIINNAVSSPIAHKVVDAAVNGAASATKQAVEKTITEALKRPREEVSKKKKDIKKLKLDLSKIVNSGSGIILD